MNDVLNPFNCEIISEEDEEIVEYDDLPGEELRLKSQKPKKRYWHLPYLYKNSHTGAVLVWKIGYNPDNNEIVIKTGQEMTTTGKVGKLTMHRRENKLNSRSNGYVEQALQDIWTAYQNKYREGYRPSHEEPVNEIMAQLAVKLIDKQTGKWKIREENLSRGISIQGKIDGIRALIWPDSMIFKSRTNKSFKWLSHIKKQITLLFTYLPDNVGLDGELYNHDLSFSDIQGAVMTIKYEHKYNKKLKYYIFDVILPNKTVEERIKILYDAYAEFLKDGNNKDTFVIMPHYWVYNYDDLNKWFNYYTKKGYEGIMIRKLAGVNPNKDQKKASYYKSGKNTNLIKMKKFHEDEGIIIDVKSAEGNDKGTALFTIEWHGIRFGCRPEGTREKRKDWYDNKEKCLGKVFTFSYFELSVDGIPRFPTGKGFRDIDYYWGCGKIIDIYKYENDVPMFILEVNLKTVKIRDNDKLNYDTGKVKCIPSGSKKEQQYMIENKNILIGLNYKFRYMNVKNNIPENVLGYGF